MSEEPLAQAPPEIGHLPIARERLSDLVPVVITHHSHLANAVKRDGFLFFVPVSCRTVHFRPYFLQDTRSSQI